MPQTTILIPTYNCAYYIKEAIESILEQSYKDYEIIVVDDGSTDHTDEIIYAIKDARILYLKNGENIGISKTLNRALLLANGKYIARMDADDIMLGTRLKDQITFLEKNQDYGMVGGWCQVINEHGYLQQLITPFLDNDMIKLALLFRNQFAQPTVTGRTQLFRQLQYDPEFICAEDHDLWFRFSEVSKVANIPSFYLSYRWHQNNTCKTKQRELKKTVLQLLSRELDKLKIDHNETELMLHGAVCFGVGDILFGVGIFDWRKIVGRFERRIKFDYDEKACI